MRKTFYESLTHMPLTSMDIHNALLVVCNDLPGEQPISISDFGDGSFHSFQWNGGSVLVLFDSKGHIDLDIFTYD